jgi:hypothetical protein
LACCFLASMGPRHIGRGNVILQLPVTRDQPAAFNGATAQTPWKHTLTFAA